MALSNADSAILQAGMAAEKIGHIAHALYWFRSYAHEGADYQLKMLREEFAKLTEAMAEFDGAIEGQVEAAMAQLASERAA